MRQFNLTCQTRGRELVEITHQLRQELEAVHIPDAAYGVLHVFIQHTSASLVICENADPSVQRDTLEFFRRYIPDAQSYFQHTAEGPDDMSAHLRTMLTQTNLTLPIREGRLALGTWQGAFVFEHRTASHQRRLVCTAQIST